jgi:hypothetical protein
VKVRGENRLRALASHLAYLEIWADAATGQPLSGPATEALALKFVAHHLWDPARRVSDARDWVPADVAESLRAERLLRCEGPMPQNTVKRRLASWGTLHHWKGSTDRSLRRVCARRFAPRRGRASARASGPSLGTSWIG